MNGDLEFEHEGQAFAVRLTKLSDGWRADVCRGDGTPTGFSVTATSEVIDDMFQTQDFEPLARLQATARDAFRGRW
jgi:hypothetical protein